MGWPNFDGLPDVTKILKYYKIVPVLDLQPVWALLGCQLPPLLALRPPLLKLRETARAGRAPHTEKLDENQVKNILEKIPLKKLGSPKDIANIAAFLSSEEASYITGQTFHVNGGMLMI